jgi:hypothetical protein
VVVFVATWFLIFTFFPLSFGQGPEWLGQKPGKSLKKGKLWKQGIQNIKNT